MVSERTFPSRSNAPLTVSPQHPQIHVLLLELAKQGKLRPQVEAAKSEMKRKIEAKKAKGQSAEDVMEE